MKLQRQSVCDDILKRTYCQEGESTPEDVQARVAKALASVEKEPAKSEVDFLAAMQQGLVMAGRVNVAAGTELQSTSMSGAVLPIGDCISGVDEGKLPGIYDTLTDATKTMRFGAGIGFDYSRIRPRGAYVAGTDSEASGPLSYLEIYNKSCEKLDTGGPRRGAQMAMLRVDHPDILEFIHAKNRRGAFENFKLSVAVTDEFMETVQLNGPIPLVHKKPPSRSRQSEHVTMRSDGLWVYDTINARDIWGAITTSTYRHGEPGVIYIDSVNEASNLGYCERIEACNPWGEQGLPAYGCCCAGSIDLTKFVRNPFSENASFDFGAYGDVVDIAVRMLDNLFDVTKWPLEALRDEAMSKRRISLGFQGLGSALVMLGIPYNSDEGRAMARNIAIVQRDRSYTASVELAIERGSFPLFDANNYLEGAFIQRLPGRLRQAVAEHGIRNSHLNALAPTKATSMAFANNVSAGMGPVAAWHVNRRVRNIEGGFDSVSLFDHAYQSWKVYSDQEGRADKEIRAGLPNYFVLAREISPLDQGRMIAELQPYVDASISCTVNVPRDYPVWELEVLYTWAWQNGVKSMSTFRPNEVREAISSDATDDNRPARRQHFDVTDPDRRIIIKKPNVSTLNCLRWSGRPAMPDGNNAKCYRVKHPKGANFALFIGETEHGGRLIPFEVWINAVEAPRGLEALAIILSYDMYAKDPGWLKKKLLSLKRCEVDGEGFALPMPPNGDTQYAPSMVAALAMLIDHRCFELGMYDGSTDSVDGIGDTPVLDALMSPKEPKTDPDGTMSCTIDVSNPNTGDDFIVGLKEAFVDIDGVTQRRPYSIWLSGSYPKALDGLCKALSLDMRVVDLSWVAKKLRELLNFAEPKGDFWAVIPGSEKRKVYPSTVAYIARLVIHRFAKLRLLDDKGYPIAPNMMVESLPPLRVVGNRSVGAMEATHYNLCQACGEDAVVNDGGGYRCTNCGDIGDFD